MKNHNGPTNAQAATTRGQNSNRDANAGRKSKDERDSIRNTLADYAQIFNSSPVFIVTTLFFFAAVMEIVPTWPMYSDIMSQMVGIISNGLSLVAGLFVLAWAAWVSHLISKRMSPSMFTYSVYNQQNFSNGSIPHAAAVEKVEIAARKDFIKGLIFGALLLTVVAGISWQRVWLQSAINAHDYSLVTRVLPVICVLVEMVTGIYINYVIRRIYLMVKEYLLDWDFTRKKERCAYETRMSHEFYVHAQSNGEKIPFSKELYDANYRYENRSLDSDEFLNPIPPLRTLTVIVMEDGRYAEGVHLSADLQDGTHANSTWTNPAGEGILSWHGEAKEVSVVYVNEEKYPGPFRENSSIRIDLDNAKSIKAA